MESLMSASKKQQKQYAPSEHVIRRIGRWRVVRSTGGYNLQHQGLQKGVLTWKNDAFRVSRDAALDLLKSKRTF